MRVLRVIDGGLWTASSDKFAEMSEKFLPASRYWQIVQRKDVLIIAMHVLSEHLWSYVLH